MGGSRHVSAGRIQSPCHPAHLHNRVLLPTGDSKSGGKTPKLELCCVCGSGGPFSWFSRRIKGWQRESTGPGQGLAPPGSFLAHNVQRWLSHQHPKAADFSYDGELTEKENQTMEKVFQGFQESTLKSVLVSGLKYFESLPSLKAGLKTTLVLIFKQLIVHVGRRKMEKSLKHTNLSKAEVFLVYMGLCCEFYVCLQIRTGSKALRAFVRKPQSFWWYYKCQVYFKKEESTRFCSVQDNGDFIILQEAACENYREVKVCGTNAL